MHRTKVLGLAVALLGCGAGSNKPPDAGPACPATSGPTTHGNDLRADEIWTAAGSPHLVTQSINVYAGVKLTIEPCATVQLAANANIDVSGSLIAEGSASRGIQFGPKDTQPWAFIRFRAPGLSRLSSVTVSGGGANSYNGTSLLIWGTGNDPPQPALKVTDVTVEKSAGLGVLVDSAGAFTDDSSNLTIRQCGSATDPFPMQVELRSAYSIPTGSYSGNTTDEIWIDEHGYETTSTALHDRGVPYRMYSPYSGLFSLYPHTGGTPPVLTIDAGITLRFAKGNGILIGASAGLPGSIVAVGTAQKPIVFTSASAAPAAGDWMGIKFQGTSTPANQLQYVVIDYAGASCSCLGSSCHPGTSEDSAVVFYSWQPPAEFLLNSTISHSAGHGVLRGWVSDAQAPDFLATNTFSNIAGCKQTAPHLTNGCPNPIPCP